MSEHIDGFDVLAAQVDQVGGGLTPGMKIVYFLRSVKKSSKGYLYSDDIKDVERNSLTWPAMIGLFQKTESLLAMEKNQHKKRPRYPIHREIPDSDEEWSDERGYTAEELQALNAIFQAQKKRDGNSQSRPRSIPRCEFCHKLGHTDDVCFKKHPCARCGKTGHGADWCPDSDKDSTSADVLKNFKKTHNVK